VRQAGLAERELMPLRIGVHAEVRVSASWLTEGDQECVGLVLHHAEPRVAALGEAQAAFAEAWTRLTSQLGSNPLPDMLRQATALAEQHFIRMALQRSQDDPAVAAQLLGVSRDSLARRRRRGSQGDPP
jgi:DNA-binding NtrC family response regulator